MIVRMSRTGNCWANAAMERCFGSLKEEWGRDTVYLSHEQARQAIFEYLEVYYTRQRRHSTLGYVSPFIYEQQLRKEAQKRFHCVQLQAVKTLRKRGKVGLLLELLLVDIEEV
jgi:hypothetical protein